VDSIRKIKRKNVQFDSICEDNPASLAKTLKRLGNVEFFNECCSENLFLPDLEYFFGLVENAQSGKTDGRRLDLDQARTFRAADDDRSLD
jgi:hypothetical protein